MQPIKKLSRRTSDEVTWLLDESMQEKIKFPYNANYVNITVEFLQQRNGTTCQCITFVSKTIYYRVHATQRWNAASPLLCYVTLPGSHKANCLLQRLNILLNSCIFCKRKGTFEFCPCVAATRSVVIGERLSHSWLRRIRYFLFIGWIL